MNDLMQKKSAEGRQIRKKRDKESRMQCFDLTAPAHVNVLFLTTM